MSWILFAILAPICWGTTNLFDKYLLEKYISNVYVYLVLAGTVGLLVLLPLPFLGLSLSSFGVVLAAFVSGICFNGSMFLYFKALLSHEASRVVPLYQLIPVFTLLLSYIFLHQQLTIQEWIAFLFLFGGGLLISFERTSDHSHIGAAFWYMLGSSAVYACFLALSGYVYQHTTYYTGLSLAAIGGFISIVPLFLLRNVRKDTWAMVVASSLRIKWLILLNELINLAAILFIRLALLSGPVAMVSVLSSVQLVYVFVMGIVLSIWFKHVLQENIAKDVLVQKLFAMACILVGMILVTL